MTLARSPVMPKITRTSAGAGGAGGSGRDRGEDVATELMTALLRSSRAAGRPRRCLRVARVARGRPPGRSGGLGAIEDLWAALRREHVRAPADERLDAVARAGH